MNRPNRRHGHATSHSMPRNDNNQFRDLDEAMGAIWFLNQFIETVNQRKEYRLELVH